MGYRRVRTPNLDAMAAGGLVFTRFYSPSAVCTPSRVSITMGRHCTRYGVMTVGGCDVPPFDNPRALPKPKGNITMAEGLKAGGYATAHCGTAHGSSTKGMDFVHHYSNAGDAETDIRGTEEALKFIGKAVAAKKPFYVRIWTSVAHKAYTPLPRHLEPYGQDPSGPYWAEVALADELLGKVRAELRALGVADQTLLWFSSDNGGHSVHEKGVLRGGKSDLYEGGVRVPGIIEYPALIRKPGRTDVPASGLDILPTVFEIAGVRPPAYELDGISLVPLLRGEMKVRPKKIPFWFRDNALNPPLHFALTDDRFKLLTTLTDRKDDELYDIPADMAEARNLAPAQPEVVARMREELAGWKASVEASMAGRD
jgi:arylsulfatase A-like enzyme